jgi:hypothetical protein
MCFVRIAILASSINKQTNKQTNDKQAHKQASTDASKQVCKQANRNNDKASRQTSDRNKKAQLNNAQALADFTALWFPTGSSHWPISFPARYWHAGNCVSIGAGRPTQFMSCSGMQAHTIHHVMLLANNIRTRTYEHNMTSRF